MRAIIAQDNQPVFVDLPTPVPATDEVLVAVRATALNRADLLQVRGLYPPPAGAPDTLGLELAGDVVALGANVTRWKMGDRVMALVAGGGYAQYATVHADHCLPIPPDMSYEHAAALPEAFLTAYTNMIDMAGLAEKETVLIHAGASGVGLACIQLARLLDVTIIVTASKPKHEICYANGAHLAIDYHTENFADRILQDHDGIDVIVDMVGASYWADNLRVIKRWGRWVFIGTQGGNKVELNIGQLMSKRLSLMGSTLRDRSITEKTQLIQQFSAWTMPHVISGILKPNVHTILDWEMVQSAHAIMRDNQNAGKIVLRVQ